MPRPSPFHVPLFTSHVTHDARDLRQLFRPVSEGAGRAAGASKPRGASRTECRTLALLEIDTSIRGCDLSYMIYQLWIIKGQR